MILILLIDANDNQDQSICEAHRPRVLFLGLLGCVIFLWTKLALLFVGPTLGEVLDAWCLTSSARAHMSELQSD